jgi:flagellar biosynthesis protein FliQ
MTPDVQDVVEVAHRMLWTTFLIAMPVLLTALLVGVLISLVQTVTGVQEMTITFVPKLFAVLVSLAVSLPWMSSVLMEFTRNLWSLMSSL